VNVKISSLLLVLAVLTCAGCASSTVSRVKLATPEEVRGYKFLGTITVTHPFGGIAKNMSYEAALTEALEKAEQMGATHFVPDKDSEAHFLGFSETVRGNAYRAPGQ
jgi:hypothetical protein